MKADSFWGRHSLSIVSLAILILWIVLYTRTDPETHWGSFLGNSVADWFGVVALVLATKHLYEKGSHESHDVPKGLHGFRKLIAEHSLSLFFAVTAAGWFYAYSRVPATSKWAMVTGSALSEWLQILALILMTKRLTEIHSKE